MNVAFVSQPWDSFIPPVQSGSIPIWTYEIVRRLQDQCNFIVYSKWKKGLQTEEKVENMICRRIPVTLDTISHKFLHRLPFADTLRRPFFSRSLYYWSYILNIVRDLPRWDCDIVHVMNFSQFVPLIRAWNPNIKTVLNMRCEWLTQLDPTMVENRLNKTDLVVGCSDYITNQIRRAYPQYEDRCTTVVNGVDPDSDYEPPRRSQDDETIRLLFVGRLSPEKGLHILLEAFKILAGSCPQVRLEIVGPEGSAPIDFIVNRSDEKSIRSLAAYYKGNYLSQLKKMIPVKLADRVTFTGFVPHDQLINYYDRADILVNPAMSESFGRSLIEAMACALPVVASHVGGMPDIVEDERTGLLVDANDAVALAEALQRLATDRELRQSLGRAGRQRVIERYSWNQVAAMLLRQYQRVNG